MLASLQERRLRRWNSRGRLPHINARVLSANSRFLHYAIAFAPAPVGMTKTFYMRRGFYMRHVICDTLFDIRRDFFRTSKFFQ